MFNWAQKNFKKSMNFNKKMFLDDSLKAVKISVKKDNKTKNKPEINKLINFINSRHTYSFSCTFGRWHC